MQPLDRQDLRNKLVELMTHTDRGDNLGVMTMAALIQATVLLDIAESIDRHAMEVMASIDALGDIDKVVTAIEALTDKLTAVTDALDDIRQALPSSSD